MSTLSKIIVTILAIVIFFVLFGVLMGIKESSGRGPGIIGLALMAGLIAALRAVWKKENGDKDERKDDGQDLQAK